MSLCVHRHHIVPKHMGGADDPTNIAVLTIPEHAAAHRLLWEKYGLLEDKIAWLMLSGKTDEGELVRRELVREYMTNRTVSAATRMKMSVSHLGEKWTADRVEKRTASRKQSGHFPTTETRQKIANGMREYHKRRKV